MAGILAQGLCTEHRRSDDRIRCGCRRHSNFLCVRVRSVHGHQCDVHDLDGIRRMARGDARIRQSSPAYQTVRTVRRLMI